MDPASHFDHLRWLLDLEARAEAQRLAEAMARQAEGKSAASGYVLTRLVVRDEAPAFGGRTLVKLQPRGAQPLPWHRLNVGTPVLLVEEETPQAQGVRGVVSSRDSHAIEVVLAQPPEAVQPRPSWRLALASDEVARQRQVEALAAAQRAQRGRLAQLRDCLLGLRPPRFSSRPLPDLLDPSLNASQRQAVAHALAAEDVALIHGPPGTGKTTAVIELIRQAVRRGEKVLACAPSHLAVDNLLERLVATGEKAIRLGHPVRVLPALQSHTLDLLVDAHPDLALARRLLRQADQLRDRAARTTRTPPPSGMRQQLRAEARQLVADAQRLEAQIASHLLDQADVVCATLTGLDAQILGDRQFDRLVIDEAAQAIEPACWIGMVRAERVVLAGDPCQLPPTILSPEAAKAGLAISLMERLAQTMPQALRQLTWQYRMHQQIMGFSSAEFYGGSLLADQTVREHLLRDLPDVADLPPTARPLLFVDTAGAGWEEQREPDGESLLNPSEAQWVLRYVRRLRQAGVRPTDMAVITPYAAQVRLLRQQTELADIEIDTVDGFQGREKEAVLVSLVRSNASGEIGFLADTRRMNVALTRARRHLAIVGDSATLCHHEFYRRLVEYAERAGAYETIWEDPENF